MSFRSCYIWSVVTSMVCVQIRSVCWTSEESLSCSPWESVCHDWTPTDATHNCMPGCESILEVRGSWLIFVCGFFLCDIRSWQSHVWWFLGMKELMNLLQRCGIGEAGPFPWPGMSCEFILLDSVYWYYAKEKIHMRVIQKVSAFLYFRGKRWGWE